MKQKVLKYGAIGIIVFVLTLGIALALNILIASAGIWALNTLELTDIALTETNAFAAGVILTIINSIIYRFRGE